MEVVETRHALRDPEWLARNPAARAADLMDAFADPAIRGIITTIGGDDSIRILPYVDLGVIAAHPKVSRLLGHHRDAPGLLPGRARFVLRAVNHGRLRREWRPLSLHDQLGAARAVRHGANRPRRAEPRRLDGGDARLGRPNEPGAPGARCSPTPAGAGRKGTAWPKGRCSAAVSRSSIGCAAPRSGPIPRPLTARSSSWRPARKPRRPRPCARVCVAMRRWASCRGWRASSWAGRAATSRPSASPSTTRPSSTSWRIEQGLTALPIVTQMDFGHTDPVFTLPYGVRARIDCARREFSILEAAVE